jgi:hypothetical protein
MFVDVKYAEFDIWCPYCSVITSAEIIKGKKYLTKQFPQDMDDRETKDPMKGYMAISREIKKIEECYEIRRNSRLDSIDRWWFELGPSRSFRL